jgi:NAD(P)H dehydrogenase (quinone)
VHGKEKQIDTNITADIVEDVYTPRSRCDTPAPCSAARGSERLQWRSKADARHGGRREPVSNMNVLIVLAHPEPRSFNAHLASLAHDTFAAHHHDVQLSDLHASGFDPCEAGRHFPVRSNPDRFDPQAEQRFNWEHHSLPSDVEREAERLLWADLVVLQFPLWWFGVPAILKGWMDRVFVYGGLYSGSRRHDTGPCHGKRALMCVTAGSPESACSPDGREGDTRLILWPTLFALRYIGFTVLRPTIMYGVRSGLAGAEADTQNSYLRTLANEYQQQLIHLDDIPIVPFNTADHWDTRGKLKADAPTYSPFIRHKAPGE